MLLHWLRRKLSKRRFAKILADLDMSIEEVLEKSPYGYSHWQGEDGYRIFDTRFKEKYVGFSYTSFNAELWILERYLLEKDEY